MKHFDELNKIFGIEPGQEPEPVPAEVSAVVPVPTQSKEEDQEDDYQLSRQTLRGMIIKNDQTISELMDLARNSEHPRTFEVVGQLVKTQSEMAKDLLGLHKQQKELSLGKQPTAPIGTQNNIMFAGSTAELMKLMKKQNEKLITPDES